MAAMEPLIRLLGIEPKEFSKHENLIIEAELFVRICDVLREGFKEDYKNYFYLLKFTVEMENMMLDSNFLRLIIKDILSTEEYTIQGIANYTSTHEDVIYDIIAGQINSPSTSFLRGTIELHRMVRPELYASLTKKIVENYLRAS